MLWGWLANLVLIIHAAYVAYVVVGLGVILAGIAMGLSWVRNFYFRVTHLAAIGLVAVEAMVGVGCPLTILEDRLRIAAGEHNYQSAGCLVHWISPLIFFDFPQWAFTIAYIACAALVALIFGLSPPDLKQW